MPEMPEVETVRRGLAPAMQGARIDQVTLNRADLRFPFPEGFVRRVEGQVIERLWRRAKYLICDLSGGEHLIMHLGMTGRFTVSGAGAIGQFLHDMEKNAHTHVIFKVKNTDGSSVIAYSDPRRFGFMDLVEEGQISNCRHFASMGPEPLSDELTARTLQNLLTGRSTPLKSALLDQRIISGLGNIYVCEALFRAGLSPRRQARSVGPARSARLVASIKAVLEKAVAAGGSTLRDFAATNGAMGYFQHGFDVYDKEGEACKKCSSEIQRIVQSGRSTFFCSNCQR